MWSLPVKLLLQATFIFLAAPILLPVTFDGFVQVVFITAWFWCALICTVLLNFPINQFYKRCFSSRSMESELREFESQQQNSSKDKLYLQGFSKETCRHVFTNSAKCALWQALRIWVILVIAARYMPQFRAPVPLLEGIEFSLAYALFSASLDTFNTLLMLFNFSKKKVELEQGEKDDLGKFFQSLGETYDNTLAKHDLEIQLNPCYESFCTRAKTYVSLGQAFPAIADVSRAIELHKTPAEALEIRGDAYKLQKLPLLARQDYESANELFLIRGKQADCRRIADKTIDLGLKSARPFGLSSSQWLLHLFFPKNIKDLSAQQLNAVAEDLTQEATSTIYFRKAEAFLNSCEHTNALDACDRAIELNPNNAEVYRLVGDVKLQTADYDEALRSYDKAISLDSLNKEAHEYRARVLLLQCKFDASIEACTFAMTFSKSQYLFMIRGFAFAAQQQHEKAIDDFTEFIEMWSGSIKVWDSLWLPAFKQIGDSLSDDLLKAYTMRAASYEAIGSVELASMDTEKVAELQKRSVRTKRSLSA